MMIPINIEVEENSHYSSHHKVHSSSWWHVSCSFYDNGHVDEPDPFLVGELA